MRRLSCDLHEVVVPPLSTPGPTSTTVAGVAGVGTATGHTLASLACGIAAPYWQKTTWVVDELL